MINKIKITLENFLFSRNYWLTRLLSTLRYSWKLRTRQPLLIHQMGKVGSSTVQRTLTKPLATDYFLFHTHMLSEKHRRIMRANYIGEKPSPLAQLEWRIGKHLFESEYVAHYYRKLRPKAKIITLIREPVGRTISRYFQIATFRDRSLQFATAADLLTDFWEQTSPTGAQSRWAFGAASTWFDTELRDLFGIDVYATPFPHAQGYAIYRGERADVLLIRLEDLNRVYQLAFEGFLSVQVDQLVHVNVGEQKSYRKTYKTFLKTVEFSEAFLSDVYQSKLATHFYTPDECDTFKRKWMRR